MCHSDDRLQLSPSFRHLGLALTALVLCSFGTYASPLTWIEKNNFRYADLSVQNAGRNGFTKLSPDTTGIHFTNVLSDLAAATNQIRMNGSGVALGDIDGDGWCDIYACGLQTRNAMYRNLGNWNFQDITKKSGTSCEDQFSTGAVMADVDGDGAVDLLVNSLGGGTRLFINDGKGQFNENVNSGLTNRFAGMTMALADIDGDTDLDLYVTNYRSTTVRSKGLTMIIRNGRRMLREEDQEHYEITPEGLLLERGEPDLLYLNDGLGQFEAIPWTDDRFLDEEGKPLDEPPPDWGQTVIFRDLNDDRFPDIYVCNDFWSPERIWINQGNGTFRSIAPQAIRSTCSFSMAADFADINRDGLDDFIVLDMLSPLHVHRMVQVAGMGNASNKHTGARLQVERNTLHLNRGDGTYAEIARLAGVEATDWSWTALFLDVDLDGHEDLLIGNGFLFDTQDMDGEQIIRSLGRQPRSKFHLKLLHYPKLLLNNMAFRNQQDLTFQDVSQEWSFDFKGITQGTALADLDNDGDLDLVSNDMNSHLGIYQNGGVAPRLAVKLKGGSLNTQGIGAKIWVRGGPVPQSQEIICGGRYLSGDNPMRVFATGQARQLEIEVLWRSGRRSVIKNAAPYRIYEISESNALPFVLPAKKAPTTAFEDVSHLLNHQHRQEWIDEWLEEPLLPRGYLQMGPAVVWLDWDRDGHEDLLIGGGTSDGFLVFRNNGNSGFQAMKHPKASGFNFSITTGMAAFSQDSGPWNIILGRGGKTADTRETKGLHIVSSSFETFQKFESQPFQVGPVAVADVNQDGRPDVFAGGSFVPGQFPLPADSRIFLNRNDRFEPDTRNNILLQQSGLVRGATWSDLDQNGWPDLILAMDWGPIRVYYNQQGNLVEATDSLGLSRFQGFWNGIATGDFNNDGRMDIVATNWGRNSSYQRHMHHAIHLYHGDFDRNGNTDLVVAYFDPVLEKIVPKLTWDHLARGIPYIKGRFFMYRDYGLASVKDILGNVADNASLLTANHLDSSIFLNRSDHFEMHPLPTEAQFAPAFAAVVGDYDGDGNEDVFLSQNFFAVRPEESRLDAGLGLWLRGNGQGGFEPLSSSASGIQIHGQQRGAALADYDKDGRMDLVVAQNGGSTKLYRNVTGKPGIRINLQGSGENPDAIGAVLRLEYQDGSWGPSREIKAGSGYWSQNSLIQVLGKKGALKAIHVRWPEGSQNSFPVPKDKRELEIIQP